MNDLENPETWDEALLNLTNLAKKYERQLQSVGPTNADRFEVGAMQAVRGINGLGVEIVHAKKDLSGAQNGFVTPASYFIFGCAVFDGQKCPDGPAAAHRMVKKFGKRLNF